MSALPRLSTTLTWNWRGSSRIASADSSVVVSQLAGSGGARITAAMRGSAAPARNSSPRPPNSPQTTKAPTARKATSLTTDSTEIARISPSWCSVGSIRRVPNAMAKAASRKATARSKAAVGAPGVSRPYSNESTTIRIVWVIDLSCSAM